MFDPTEEYFIIYSIADGRRTSRGHCPAGQSGAQWLEPGEALLLLPAEVAAGDLSLHLSALRDAVWEETKRRRDAAIDGGAVTPSGVVDSDALSRSNISGAVLAALIAQSASAAFTMEWTLKDNSVVTLSAAQMIALGLAVMTHVNACHDNARTLRAQIEAAADVTELLQIDIGAGWP